MTEELEKEEEKPEEEVEKEIEEKLAFPMAPVVRQMKQHIAKGKIVRKEVKIGMNNFLAEIVKDIATTMDKFPYSTVDYRMFEEAVKPYKQVKELQAEKRRLEAHLDAIVQDCLSVKRDLETKFAEPEKK